MKTRDQITNHATDTVKEERNRERGCIKKKEMVSTKPKEQIRSEITQNAKELKNIQEIGNIFTEKYKLTYNTTYGSSSKTINRIWGSHTEKSGIFTPTTSVPTVQRLGARMRGPVKNLPKCTKD